MQAEKPLSDAFGLFFVITAVLFFYLAVERIHGTQRNCFRAHGKATGEDKISLWYLAWGGLLLGLGLGVRVTYLALIPTMAYAAYQVNKRVCGKKITLWGGAGLVIGVFLWLGYLIAQFTPYKVYRKLLSHADYH